MFPPATFFIGACRGVLSSLSEEASVLPVTVIEELQWWSFLDSWTEPIPWRLQQHLGLRIFTDASLFAWGALVTSGSEPLVMRDFSPVHLQPLEINVKEALALFLALSALSSKLWDRRVDAYVDNRALYDNWQAQRANSVVLNGVLRSIAELLIEFNAG